MIYSNDLQYYVGKPILIHTVQVNFRFKEEQMYDYFVGFLEKVDDKGFTIVHHITKCKTFISMDYAVAVAEEQVAYDDIPEDKKIIDEYRKEKPITAAKRTITPMPLPPLKNPNSPFVNPKAMAELAKAAKEIRDKK